MELGSVSRKLKTHLIALRLCTAACFICSCRIALEACFLEHAVKRPSAFETGAHV
jgi:hypothetical protein